MGAYSPTPSFPQALQEAAMAGIIRPALAEMARRGTPFRGILYAGLMLTAEGVKLIEFNVRFGDPECQALLPRLMSDLLPALQAAYDGELENFDLRWNDIASIAVVMAARGYPEAPERGSEIRGLDRAAAMPGVQVFHAGTEADFGRTRSRRRRPRAERLRHGSGCAGRAGCRVCRGTADRLAGGLLPARYRVARAAVKPDRAARHLPCYRLEAKNARSSTSRLRLAHAAHHLRPVRAGSCIEHPCTVLDATALRIVRAEHQPPHPEEARRLGAHWARLQRHHQLAIRQPHLAAQCSSRAQRQ